MDRRARIRGVVGSCQRPPQCRPLRPDRGDEAGGGSAGARGVSQRASCRSPTPFTPHRWTRSSTSSSPPSETSHRRRREPAPYSTVTGSLIDHSEIDAKYFGRNVRQTVRFAEAIDAMSADGIDVIVEVAPHPVLAISIAECLAAGDVSVPIAASMRRDRSGRGTMLQACATLYAAGHLPHWEAVTGAPTVPADLPAYPWQRERYWLREAPAGTGRAALPTRRTHPLLGHRERGDAEQPISYCATWPADALTWVADHVLGGHVLMPGAGLVATILAAAAERGFRRARRFRRGSATGG